MTVLGDLPGGGRGSRAQRRGAPLVCFHKFPSGLLVREVESGGRAGTRRRGMWGTGQALWRGRVWIV